MIAALPTALTATLAVASIPHVTSCTNCGAENAADARFCSACGQTLVTRVGAQERRVVTALFADLVGSTSLGERLDPEVMRDLVGRFFEAATDEIRTRGGSVERFSGDAVMGLFGLAVAHEDDAERALRAAVAIHAATEGLGAAALERHGIRLQARIGVESGEVVVGDPFGGATMATGDALNLAARLEQAAGPGQTLVGPAARDATRQVAILESLGELELAGKEARVPAWRLVSVSDEIGGGRGVPGLSAPMTGRDEELELLLDAAQRSRTEQKATLFTVLGAPGVGKSRLAREFAARVSAGGTSVMRGRCLPYGEGITYWPLAEMLRQVAKITPEMSSAEALERVQAISGDDAVADRLAFAVGLRSQPPVAGEGIDREIAWAFRRLFETYPVSGPMVLIFEDIHWAEPALLDLIEYLIAFVRGVPAMVLCLARPELLDHRPAWGAGRVESSRILLEPLGPEESASLLSALLAVQDLPEPLVRRVLERSEGNPLFVEEVVRMLIDEGVVGRQGDRWVATAAAADVRVPETVEALIRARLDTLPRPERSLLQGASVVGRVFQHSAVAAILENGHDLRTHLDDAVLRDLITEERSPDPEPTYRFKHILIRDVAYASLPKARRADLHARVADWLAAWAGERLSEFLEIQAHHLEQAALLQRELEGRADPTLVDRAVGALQQSSRASLARDDFGAAERFAARAVDILEPTHPGRLDAEALVLEALYRQSHYRRMGELGARVAVAAAAAGRPDLEGRGLLAKAIGTWLSVDEPDKPRAQTLLEQARQVLERAGDQAHLVEAVMMLGFGGWWDGDLDEAARRWHEAAGLAHAANDPGREAMATLMLSRARAQQGDSASRAELLAEAVRLAEASGSALTRARMKRGEGILLAQTTSLERGLELVLATLPVFEEAMDREEHSVALYLSGEIYVLMGRPEAAIELTERAIELLEEVGHTGALPEAERVLAEALLELGRINYAERHALRAAEIVAPGDVGTIATTHTALGRVRDAQGRDSEAERLLRDAIVVIDGTQYRSNSWEEYLALAEFLARRGREEEAEAALATARERALLLGPQTPMIDVIERRAAAARAGAPRAT